MKKHYFLSDAHLGSRVVRDPRAHEQRLVDWLDMAKRDAAAIYLLGDIFDFWFEYKMVIPKGHTRVLGKLCELTDSGIPVHFFIGNHDLWTFGYLAEEIGLIVHYSPLLVELSGQHFLMAHGDGLADKSRSFSLIRGIFHSKICQRLFRAVPPTWGLSFGFSWSESNRRKHEPHSYQYKGDSEEPLMLFASQHPGKREIDYFVFGHRHLLLDKPVGEGARLIVLGDFMCKFTYGVFDGSEMRLEHF